MLGQNPSSEICLAGTAAVLAHAKRAPFERRRRFFENGVRAFTSFTWKTLFRKINGIKVLQEVEATFVILIILQMILTNNTVQCRVHHNRICEHVFLKLWQKWLSRVSV